MELKISEGERVITTALAYAFTTCTGIVGQYNDMVESQRKVIDDLSKQVNDLKAKYEPVVEKTA